LTGLSPITVRIPRLHVITDTTTQRRYSHLQLAELAWAAGPCAVQYRQKAFSNVVDLPELKALAAIAHAGGQCLIINDRVDLAFDLGATGVHLGQGDGDPRAAVQLLGPQALIGATVHTRAELDALAGAAIHYIGVGPVYGTSSKATGLPDLGLDGLAAICAASPWPVIAIGGIGLTHVAEVLAAGAHGVAVISAFCLASDPQGIAREFLEKLGHE
jgi:thiamine-phosphate pyrophosphorylase